MTMKEKYLDAMMFNLAMNLTMTAAMKGLQRLAKNLDDLFQKVIGKQRGEGAQEREFV